MRFLLDINVLMDALLPRPPWHTDALALWRAASDQRFTGYVTATAITTIFYLVQRQLGPAAAFTAVRNCLIAFPLCPVDHQTIFRALALPGPDFEDNVQIACAVGSGLDGIITRDPAGFRHAPLPVLTPVDALSRLPR